MQNTHNYQSSFLSFQLITILFFSVNGEQAVEDEEEEEELYELTSLPNGETSDISSEAEEAQSMEKESEMPGFKEDDTASCTSEATLDLQRSIIEDIR